MVERRFDSVQVAIGLMAVFFKWLFFKIWTVLGIGMSIYGLGLLVLIYHFNIDYSNGLGNRVTPFELPVIIFYGMSVFLLGAAVAWLNLQNGNHPIKRRHRYVYQVLATISVTILIVIYPELHSSVLELIGV